MTLLKRLTQLSLAATAALGSVTVATQAQAFLLFDNDALDANVVDSIEFNQGSATTTVEETFGDTGSEFAKTLIVTPADTLRSQTLTFAVTNGLTLPINGYRFSFFNQGGTPANIDFITDVVSDVTSTITRTDNLIRLALSENVGSGDALNVTFTVDTSDLEALDVYGIVQEAEAIPTPAMLPGLMGLGVAAWRRRRVAVGS